MGKATKRRADDDEGGGGGGEESPLPKLVLKVGGKEKKPKVNIL